MGRPAKDLTGQRFGRLTVIKRVKNYRNAHASWECQCECGNKTAVLSSNLGASQTTSCGCLAREITSLRGRANKLPKGEASFNSLFRGYKRSAEKRGHKWNLTKEKFKELTKQNCYYCGRPPFNKRIHNKITTNGAYIYNGVDRIDNSKGYTKNNSVSCCKDCNRAKRKLTQTEFLQLVAKIYNNVLNKNRQN